MDAKPLSLAQRLQGIGIKKSYAYMLASGDRKPPLKLAVRIHQELGVKLGPLADVADKDIRALARVTNPDAAA